MCSHHPPLSYGQVHLASAGLLPSQASVTTYGSGSLPFTFARTTLPRRATSLTAR